MTGLLMMFLGSMIGAWWLTGLLRRYALARRLIDVPNERSSHVSPTPRGGGLSIVLVFLLGTWVLQTWGLLSWHSAVALSGAGALVALIGFIDDHRHIAAKWRLMGHFAAATWALFWIGALPPLPIFGRLIDLDGMGYVFGALYLVWLLNLYNFMDGIDGIAGIEAITVSIGAAILSGLAGATGAALLLPLLLTAGVAGFLFWNFPPARIFMGDVGSAFLGITLGMLSLISASQVPALFWAWVILLGVFVVDATVTLLCRIGRGQRPHEAHRSHAYQHASRHLKAHRPVSLSIGAINVLWLFPWALAVTLNWVDGSIAIAIAYAPLVVVALIFKAGAPGPQEA